MSRAKRATADLSRVRQSRPRSRSCVRGRGKGSPSGSPRRLLFGGLRAGSGRAWVPNGPDTSTRVIDCARCEHIGFSWEPHWSTSESRIVFRLEACPECEGTGKRHQCVTPGCICAH